MPVPAPGADDLLAGGPTGPRALRPLLDTVLDALATGAAERSGPLPAGGPHALAQHVRALAEPALPDTGTGAPEALHTLVRALAAGAADPAEPHCAAHLHCPPLAVAAAADLAVSALNPSLDSWDQAPAASELETLTCRALATLAYGHRPAEDDRPRHEGRPAQGDRSTHEGRPAQGSPPAHGDRPAHQGQPPTPDALVTTGGTEANQLALLLAREAHPGPTPLQVICGANAHHSIHRAAWLLGLPTPHTLPTPTGRLDPDRLAAALHTRADHPTLVIATAGTTDTGAIDPLPAIADLCAAHHATLHIDASYGGALLFSDTLRDRLHGLDRAHSIALDLHKLGWQPIAAGLLAVPDHTALTPLDHHVDYLNAADDTEAGLPDLLGRSLRTSRRPDILKIAVTLRALGRHGLGRLVERCCATAHHLAELIDAHPRLELHAPPAISTVLFRPTGADDTTVAAVRRRLIRAGHAVLGRAHTADGLWLKATLLNPHTRPSDLHALLRLVEGSTAP
ncbi:aminotransferase class V-fold PLP-dependent enzyme [Streptomyces sp. LX-29]|uniref:pyridoxal phosphate-dependent decarboxylase family protein n=1 Tax=Streptomyces sp. LX-29 TaxID=2900152 RepID=UPI00240E87BA|nr:aminotransferase class V-fold PLP-dependent enzyme [Streptomyces sp. LX-29]WFB10084.1 aminotransferase class V-fold PLP-dependent enzyme [Streptomyces sp. LX-29]